ncbi:hypothetical protein Tco_1581992, partial [Tanacetum coccineum]
MSSDSAHSTVSYTSISSKARSWSIPTVDPYEEAARQALEQASPPLSPAYVHEQVYPEYLAPSDDDISIKYQPLPADASPTALSPGYIADADPKEDPDEDLEEDPADYLVDGGDEEKEEEESSGDDTDDEDEDEASEEEDDDEDEVEHLAPADSTAIPIDDPVPSAEETKPFEIDESAPTPPPPIAASIEARIAEYAATPTPPSLPPSPLPYIPSPPLPLLSPPTHTSPTYAEAPLGYRAAMIRSRAASPLPLHAPSSPMLFPATNRREDVSEAGVPPQKRLCLTAPTPRFEIRESSAAAAAARHPGSSVAHIADYSFVDIMDASIQAVEERAMAAVRVVNLRVSYQVDVRMRDDEEFYTRHQDARDDRAAVRAKIE